MAEFTGFYYDNIHSSTYHLYRTSDGNRYEHGLIPDFEDRSVSLVGTDGDLYGERRFKATPFTIKLAYDSLTEDDLKAISIWLSSDELKPFQFDESPYKTYYVKPSSRPILNYICFMEEDDAGLSRRVYKGEGSITFTAYDPFGYCIDESKELGLYDGAPAMISTGKRNRQNLDFYTSLGYTHGDDFSDFPIPWKGMELYNIGDRTKTDLSLDNTIEWAHSAGLLHTDSYNRYNQFALYEDFEGNSVLQALVYNPGDKETSFQLLIHIKAYMPPAQQKIVDALGEEECQLYEYDEVRNYPKYSEPRKTKNTTSQVIKQNIYNANLHKNDLSKADFKKMIDAANNANDKRVTYRQKQARQDKELSNYKFTLFIDNGIGTEVKSSLVIKLTPEIVNGAYLLIDTKRHLVSLWDGVDWQGRFDLVYDIPNNNWPTIPCGASRIAFNGDISNNFDCSIKYDYIFY